MKENGESEPAVPLHIPRFQFLFKQAVDCTFGAVAHWVKLKSTPPIITTNKQTGLLLIYPDPSKSMNSISPSASKLWQLLSKNQDGVKYIACIFSKKKNINCIHFGIFTELLTEVTRVTIPYTVLFLQDSMEIRQPLFPL